MTTEKSGFHFANFFCANLPPSVALARVRSRRRIITEKTFLVYGSSSRSSRRADFVEKWEKPLAQLDSACGKPCGQLVEKCQVIHKLSTFCPHWSVDNFPTDATTERAFGALFAGPKPTFFVRRNAPAHDIIRQNVVQNRPPKRTRRPTEKTCPKTGKPLAKPTRIVYTVRNRPRRWN